MSRPLLKILDEAIELGEEDRALLAGLLLESIEAEPDHDVEKAWAAEIQRRVSSLENGEAELIPWKEVKRSVHAKLKGNLDCI